MINKKVRLRICIVYINALRTFMLLTCEILYGKIYMKQILWRLYEKNFYAFSVSIIGNHLYFVVMVDGNRESNTANLAF